MIDDKDHDGVNVYNVEINNYEPTKQTKTNNGDFEEKLIADNEDKYFGFNMNQYEQSPFLPQNNEKDCEINMFLNNTLFEEDPDIKIKNTHSIKVNKEEDQLKNQIQTKNINQIFGTIFSTDNLSATSSCNTQNLKTQNPINQINSSDKVAPIVKIINSTLSNKRIREENNSKSKQNSKLNNKANSIQNNLIENLPLSNNLNQQLNFAVINPQNLAHLQKLIPNFNLLSNNIGVVNWVLPMNNEES